MGQVKQYLSWHIDKYGTEPIDWDHVDEFIAERDGRVLLAEYEPSDLGNAETVSAIRVYSPCIDLLLRIQSGEIDLYDVNWRDFERIVAELLGSDGWNVELQRGTKDGGVDILAKKSGLKCGDVLTLWQAKRLGKGRKVGIDTIRELADTRNEFKASKGVIVTSSYLTLGAIKRVDREAFILGKVDREDLGEWIRKYKP